MFTADENVKIKDIRKRAESGDAGSVSKEDRQWLLDMFKREGIPMPQEVIDGAKQMGFDVEGIKVKQND